MQFGDGSTSRDYTYISDIVDGVIRSLDRPAGYQIYNLGNGNPVRLSTFIGLVEESVGHPARIRVCPEQPGDVPRTCADVTKARVMLGYDPSVPFADGIRATVRWYKERFGCPADDASAVNPSTATATATAITTSTSTLPAAAAAAAEASFRKDKGMFERVSRSMSCATASDFVGVVGGVEFLGLRDDGVGAGDGQFTRSRSLSKPECMEGGGARVRRAVSVSYAF